jgi:hypothetical protein
MLLVDTDAILPMAIQRARQKVRIGNKNFDRSFLQ